MTFDSVGPSGGAGTGSYSSPTTWTHTTVAPSTTVLVFACLDGVATGVTASATLGGTTMTQLGSDVACGTGGTSGILRVWSMAAVASGAHTIVVTCASQNDFSGGSIAYVTTGLGTPATNAGSANGTTAYINVPSSTAGNTICAFIGSGNLITATTGPAVSRVIGGAAAGDGANWTGSGGAAGGNAACSDVAAGGSVTVTWSTASTVAATFAVEVGAAPGGQAERQPQQLSRIAKHRRGAAQQQQYAFQLPSAQVNPVPVAITTAQPAATVTSGPPCLIGIAGTPGAGWFTDNASNPKLWVASETWGLPNRAGEWNGGSYENDYTNFFGARAAQGVTVVMTDFLSGPDPSTGSPYANGTTWDGVTPFVSGGDPTTGLNSTFWARVDYAYTAAAAAGITIAFVFNAYDFANGGYCASWTDTQFQAFGAAVGARYASRTNLVWLFGNDAYQGTYDTAWNYIVTGIRGAGDTHLIAGAWWSAEYTSRYETDNNAVCTWGVTNSIGNFCYTYNAGYWVIEYAYAETGSPDDQANLLPTFWGDGYFYQGSGTSPMTYSSTFDRAQRQETWWTLAAGARGFLTESETIYPWSSAAALTAVTETWQFVYNLPNIVTYYSGLTEWNKLLPDLTSAFVTAGRGTRVTGYASGGSGGTYENAFTNSWVAASITPDGHLAICYLPNHTTITCTTTMLASGWTASWVDPITCATSSAGTGPTFNSTAKGTNSQGDPDWVLVFRAGAGSGATVTPAAVTITAAFPAVAVPPPAAPAVVARTTAVPAPASISGSLTAAVLAATTAVPAPVVRQDQAVTPAVLAVTTTQPAPSAISGSITLASALAVITAQPAPAASGSAAVTLGSAVAVTTTAPAPAVSGSAAAAPAVLAVTTTQPAPASLSGSATVAVLTLTAAQPPPAAISGGLTAGILAVTTTVPAVTVTTSGNANVIMGSALAVAATQPAPAVSGSATASPAALTVTTTTPVPASITGSLTAATLTVSTAQPAATVTAGGISYNTGATATADAAAACNVTIPAGVLTGDLMIMSLLLFTETSSAPTVAFSGAGGTWTLIPVSAGTNPEQSASGAIYSYGYAYSRVATSGDPGATLTITETGSPSGTTWIGVAVASYTGAVAVDVAAGAETYAAAGSVTTPSRTTGAAGDWAVYLWSGGPGVGATITGPAGTTKRQNIVDGAGIGAGAWDSNGPVGAAGTSIGGGTFSGATGSNGWWQAFTIGLVSAAGSATATPATLAATTTAPAPASIAGSLTAGILAVTTAQPAPAVSGSAAASPAVLAVTASTPAPAASGSAVIAPGSALAVTSTVPSPASISGGLTTAAAAATTAQPAPASISGSLTAAALAVTTAQPAAAVTVGGSATAAPATLAVTTTQPAPVVRQDRAIAAAVVTVTSTVPGPAVSGTLTAAVLTATTAQPAPASISGTLTAATLAAATAQPAVTVTTTGSALVTPAAVTAASAIATPPVTTGSGTSVTPAALAVSTSAPAPVVRQDITAAPAALSVTSAQPAVTVTAVSNAAAAPSALAAITSVPLPAVTAGGSATASPATLSAAVTVPAPAAATGTLVTVTVLAVTTSVPGVSASGGAAASPVLLAVPVTVPAASVSTAGNANVAAVTVTVVFTAPQPAVRQDRAVTAVTVSVTATFPAAEAAGISGITGTVAWTARPCAPRWQARPAPPRWQARPAPSRWRVVMTAFQPVAAASLAYVNITWTSELLGTVIDPTGQSEGSTLLPVQMAFPVSSGNPLEPAQAVTWYTASWLLGSTAAGYTSQCLVGPTGEGGLVQLTAGMEYDAWGSVQGTPEIPKIFAGTLPAY